MELEQPWASAGACPRQKAKPVVLNSRNMEQQGGTAYTPYRRVLLQCSCESTLQMLFFQYLQEVQKGVMKPHHAQVRK